jgi:5-methylcytosine-specific restriction endonuclease McrA
MRDFVVRRVPDVVQPLRDGRLCITSIIELAKVLTPENRAEVLPRFFHRSRQEAKAVSAEMRPAEAAPHRTVLTALRMALLPSGAPACDRAPLEQGCAVPEPVAVPAVQPVEQDLRVAGPRSVPRSTAEPLSADLRRLHVTVSKRFVDKLEAAKDALSHSHPGADVEAILEAGLDLLIERAAKRKGIVAKPRKPPPSVAASRPSRRPEGDEAGERAIPAAVRREVWIRDGGRCQWPTSDGGVCGSTCRVQFDHIVPVARGGKSTVANLRLACAVHNDRAARQAYGDAWMDRFTRGTHQPSLPAAPT